MFNKISCKNCGKKVSKDSSFCPHCGNYLSPYKPKKTKNRKEDYGMLGENDEIHEDHFVNPLFSGISGKILNKLFDSTMKMLEKEMQKSMKDTQKFPKNPKTNTHFELYINGKRIDPKKVKITQMPVHAVQTKNKRENFSDKYFSPEYGKKFLKFNAKEPETKLRRLSDKIIYEISVPGVKKIDNVSIIKAGNSIEVKAVSEKNSYMKVIPFDMNILKYDLSDEKITLELEE